MIRRSLALLVCCSMLTGISAHSAVVEITTENSVGQGFIYPHEGECWLATPDHVIRDASRIAVKTPTRDIFKASLEASFAGGISNIDLAKLSTTVPRWQCKDATLEPVSPLDTLLSVYDEGVLKTMIGDGSLQQIKVVITGVKDAEYLAIRAVNSADQFKQGQSGSTLFVADVPVGMLIQIEDGEGIVYRMDAIASWFAGAKAPGSSQEDKLGSSSVTSADMNIGEKLSVKLSANEKKTATIDLRSNSPIEFQMIAVAGGPSYTLSVLDSSGAQVFAKGLRSPYAGRVAFTPKQDGVHTIQLVGTKGHGGVKLKVNQFALDSELTGDSNVVTPGDGIETRLATATTARYKIRLYANSPIEFQMIAVAGGPSYTLSVLDSSGAQVFAQGLRSPYAARVAFTPKQDGVHTIQLVGTMGHGGVKLKVNQWALDSELTGDSNVVTPGDGIETRLATATTARYKIRLYANSPIEFQMIAVAGGPSYTLSVLDSSGAQVFAQGLRSPYAGRVAFTPKQDGVHTIQLVGTKGHGGVKLKVNQFALDSELTGDSNVVTPGDGIETRLATATTARYKIRLYANSPIELQTIAVAGGPSYRLSVLDSSGAQVFAQGLRSPYAARVAFTPKQDGVHTIQLVGTKGHGKVRLNINGN